jgi:hypothetical protein
MKEYMLLFRNEKTDQEPSAEQMKMAMQQWQSWITGVAKEGRYSGTNRLLSEGKTIKPGNVVTDGPYLEAKEMVGGYLVIKANSLDDALQIARACPNLLYGGNVEVRAVMAIDGNPSSGTFLHPKN